MKEKINKLVRKHLNSSFFDLKEFNIAPYIEKDIIIDLKNLYNIGVEESIVFFVNPNIDGISSLITDKSFRFHYKDDNFDNFLWKNIDKVNYIDDKFIFSFFTNENIIINEDKITGLFKYDDLNTRDIEIINNKYATLLSEIATLYENTEHTEYIILQEKISLNQDIIESDTTNLDNKIISINNNIKLLQIFINNYFNTERWQSRIFGSKFELSTYRFILTAFQFEKKTGIKLDDIDENPEFEKQFIEFCKDDNQINYAINEIKYCLNYIKFFEQNGEKIDGWEEIFKQYSVLLSIKGNYYNSLNYLLKTYKPNNDDYEFKNNVEELYGKFKDNFNNYKISDRKFILIENEVNELSAKSFKILRHKDLPDISLPIGHPIEGEVYACHPFNNTSYFPISTYDEMLFMDRFDEFNYFLQALGATKITIENTRATSIEENSSQNNEKELNIEVDISVVSGKYSENNTDNNKKQDINNNKKYISREQTFLPTKKPYLPDNLIWYYNEPSWQRLFELRTNGNIISHKESISTEQQQFISNKERNNIKHELEIRIWKIKGGFSENDETQIEQTIKKNESIEWIVNIEFAPIDSLQEKIVKNHAHRTWH